MPSTSTITNELSAAAEEVWSELDNPPEHLQEDMLTLFSMSEFAQRVCQRHGNTLTDLSERGLLSNLPCESTTINSLFTEMIVPDIDDCDSEEALNSTLRRWRNQLLFAIAYHDIVKQQPIESSLRQVSALADTLIVAAYEWQYNKLSARHGAPVHDSKPQPLCIIAMGKLGGRELNFSSDIDLIFAYPEKGDTQTDPEKRQKSIENQQFFTRLAQRLIHCLDTVTADGFVFRVDMRLRPFGDSGPLVTHFDALEIYYQEQGREWERYAMLKGRIINPPSPHTDALYKMLQPFVYKRYIDFTALEALRSMKMLIEKEVRRKGLVDNIKLGKGGIREVEFFVQSMQLIHAGKHRTLQTPSLHDALAALVDAELIDSEDAQTLIEDYHLLRKAEHCLQQFNDEQTQQLPDTPRDQYRLTTLLNQPDWDDTRKLIDQAMARIHAQFNQLIETPEQESDADNPLLQSCDDLWNLSLSEADWQGVLSDTLTPEAASDLFELASELRQKMLKSHMGQRGQSIVNRLLPQLLFDLLSRDDDLRVDLFARVSPLLAKIAGRTPYLDLLLENYPARVQLLTLCAQSPWIANQLAEFPLLLDELLSLRYLEKQHLNIDDMRASLQADLQQALLRIDPDDLESMMNAWRQFKLCQQLTIAAADVMGTLPTNQVSDYLTALAEVLLDSVVRYAWKDMQRRFGEPSGNNVDQPDLVIIAYGKFGGYELGYGSDLDLVFLHGAHRDQYTDGAKEVSAQQFYVKLVQRFMHLMTTNTQLGDIYDIDLRLRPDGSAGMLCSHIDGFDDYQQQQAWTWEHQALVRARPVWGSSALTDKFARIRHDILAYPRDPSELSKRVTEMREKMRQHLLKTQTGYVDLKQSEGGITDIEFMVQFWVLAFAADCPELLKYPDNLRILDAVSAAQITPDKNVKALQASYLSLRQSIHRANLQNQEVNAVSDEISAHLDVVKTLYCDLFDAL
ncbi:bifunctional [glutamate--ammonia ligase]-adenylyl-L-tyrosine phosphorylase/[glutamate--ammonia-ligase] adenylyltransferase [Alteromonas oceanisediminis]|uniref:bifunctional [glutamate--ammonia ligase]-adenylyl-L-tyrosine phosphorylase/[glutamate--ammonia-ligase] adenylyltransferase n=1 Tax=Alteromonas oceanisediminis TaxID=2836180 RepID=UPI001BDAEBE2|nr:bifunctional [glutamate--ammonia ligase]-adenylyl-L-tyrosine phosphorylase/[glutamate--ammonia-ligase] adenylyltransferase [Alteromonas oceanisediminis]MBT0585652.1 bifunctional [glutamate--ammonia ligase]-adenylyl-L-tyrosine phosphorylase/[glutamate--ammonia-ligase] adenylyltransferase [Alteromonas oceanisediminis]